MTSKQDYEEVAAHDAQRGVDPYDGIELDYYSSLVKSSSKSRVRKIVSSGV